MARLKTTHQTAVKAPYSLNEQIHRLQQQMANEQILQQQQQQQFRLILTDRLTSWPVLLGAIAAGVMLRQISTAAKAPQQPPVVASSEPAADITSELTPGSTTSQAVKTAAAAPESTSFWGTLLSLPLLTQSIWWLLQQLWQSRLFRDLVRQKLIKSEHRHPPY